MTTHHLQRGGLDPGARRDEMSKTRVLLGVLVLAALLAASGAEAKPTNQVLVLTTATRVDTAAFAYRNGIVIQNNGPNTIYCSIGDSAGLAVNTGMQVVPGDTWSIPVRQYVPVYCLSSVAQVAGAATDVSEL